MSIIEETKQALLDGLFADAVEPEPAPPVEGEGEETEAVEDAPRANGVLELNFADRGFHLDAQVDSEQVVEAATILDELGYYIEAVTGVDWIKEEQMEVIYDYSRSDGQSCRVAVRARIDRETPNVPTISEVFPGADWHERETHDFFGIKFVGHPYLVPLLLPEDADFHPLLKDFTP